MHKHNSTRGFTLTEILVALAIFALGGTAIMALFITNIKVSRQAMDYTRAAEIARNVRSLITQAASRPIPEGETSAMYQFYYPGTSLTLTPDQYLDEYESEGSRDPLEEIGGTPQENSVFFRLPRQAFNATSNFPDNEQMVTKLPEHGMNQQGAKIEPNPRVFRFKPAMLRRAGALTGFDPDDRHAYQFDFQIRRSVLRAGVEDARGTGRKQPLEDLFVVHIRVYKGYDFEGGGTPPYFEWDFFVSATRAGQLSSETP